MILNLLLKKINVYIIKVLNIENKISNKKKIKNNIFFMKIKIKKSSKNLNK